MSEFTTCPLGHKQIPFVFEFIDELGTRVTARTHGGPAKYFASEHVSLLACADCGIGFISFEEEGSDKQ